MKDTLGFRKQSGSQVSWFVFCEESGTVVAENLTWVDASNIVRSYNAHAALIEACSNALARLQVYNQYEGWADKKLIKQLYDALDAANNQE